MKPRIYWDSARIWVCARHMRGVRLPAEATSCYYHKCDSTRPSMSERPEPSAEPEPVAPIVRAPRLRACDWTQCREPARPGSKYCSRRCSNRNARQRHRKRKRAAA